VDWALGLRQAAPDTAVAAASAGIRLDDALRLYLAEQGTKRMSKHDLWTLVLATTRVRLTAASLAGLCAYCPPVGPAAQDGLDADAEQVGTLRRVTTDLADFYQGIAVEVTGRRGEPMPAVPVAPSLDGAEPAAAPDGTPGTDGARAGTDGARAGTDASKPGQPHVLWVREQLQDLVSHASDITAPAAHVAQMRRVPWWR
jgi:hypothetical protein